MMIYDNYDNFENIVAKCIEWWWLNYDNNLDNLL